MDVVDRANAGKKVSCPVCGQEFEDIQAEVAVAIRNGHINRHHKGAT